VVLGCAVEKLVGPLKGQSWERTSLSSKGIFVGGRSGLYWKRRCVSKLLASRKEQK